MTHLRTLLHEHELAERTLDFDRDRVTRDIRRDVRAVLREELGLSDAEMRTLGEVASYV